MFRSPYFHVNVEITECSAFVHDLSLATAHVPVVVFIGKVQAGYIVFVVIVFFFVVVFFVVVVVVVVFLLELGRAEGRGWGHNSEMFEAFP